MTTYNLDQPIFTLLMQAQAGVYSPELDGEQLTDRDVLIRDILAGQFAGEFVSLLQSERMADGKIATFDVSIEVTEAMEEADEFEGGWSDYDRIGSFEAGVQSVRRFA